MRKRCARRPCPEYVGVGTSYCPRHKPYGAGWAALRSEILRRDEWQCRCDGCNVCSGWPCMLTADTVDHIDGDALHDEPWNLRAFCRPCNSAKGGIA